MGDLYQATDSKLGRRLSCQLHVSGYLFERDVPKNFEIDAQMDRVPVQCLGISAFFDANDSARLSDVPAVKGRQNYYGIANLESRA